MRDVLFIGTVLASVTHEMQNVMAIIKESGALTDDILRLNAPLRLRHGDKLDSALENIQEQVGRGRDLMLMLNGFAHAAADHPAQSDIRRFARQIGVLAERMVRLKDCVMHVALDGPPLFVRANALLVMQSVYLGIAAAVENCPPGDTLRLTVMPADETGAHAGRTGLTVTTERNRAVPSLVALEPVMTQIGGQCRAHAGELVLEYRAGTGQDGPEAA